MQWGKGKWLLGWALLLSGCVSGIAQAAMPESRKISFEGADRTYLYYVPRMPVATKLPLVVLLHGGTQSAEQVWRQTSLPLLAAKEGFILLAPNGYNKHWNDGRGAVVGGRASNADDAGYILTLVNLMVREHGADPRSIFVTGASNGGFMAYKMICEYGEVFVAAAPVIAPLSEYQSQHCPARNLRPIMMTQGTADPILSYKGGVEPKSGVAMLSGEQTLAFFLRRSGCSGERTTQLPDTNKDDDSTVTQINGTGCAVPVEYLRVNGGGHSWPGRVGMELRVILGPTNRDIDSGEKIWNFFKTQQKLGG
ncbi:MAG: hypothetical protein KBA75_01700 [Alphaproteobacteria bacterium]|nr:hypothetical protein [Alphaproteobacteria bacterium]